MNFIGAFVHLGRRNTHSTHTHKSQFSRLNFNKNKLNNKIIIKNNEITDHLSPGHLKETMENLIPPPSCIFIYYLSTLITFTSKKKTKIACSSKVKLDTKRITIAKL